MLIIVHDCYTEFKIVQKSIFITNFTYLLMFLHIHETHPKLNNNYVSWDVLYDT